MKATIILVVIIISFWGCSDSDEYFTNPGEQQLDLLKTPTPLLSSPMEEISISKLIDGTLGGEILLDTTFVNTAGDTISIYARLKVLENSFPGIVEITMVPDYDSLSIEFFPQMVFLRELMLTLRYTGTDLVSRGYTSTGVADFVYYGNNGLVHVQNNGVLVNIPQDQIKVMAAKLPHFSRYGFTRRPGVILSFEILND